MAQTNPLSKDGAACEQDDNTSPISSPTTSTASTVDSMMPTPTPLPTEQRGSRLPRAHGAAGDGAIDEQLAATKRWLAEEFDSDDDLEDLDACDGSYEVTQNWPVTAPALDMGRPPVPPSERISILGCLNQNCAQYSGRTVLNKPLDISMRHAPQRLL